MIKKQSPRQKSMERQWIKSLNKTAPGTENEIFKVWKKGQVTFTELIEFRNFYVTKGYRSGYQQGYDEGYAEGWN